MNSRRESLNQRGPALAAGQQSDALASRPAAPARETGHKIVLDNRILAAKKIQEQIENG
jgi:hypothetical protein